MRILFKLLFKLLMFVGIIYLSSKGIKGAGLFGGGGNPAAILGADGAPVTKEENDLTGTVFSSAMKLVTGQASRSELASELSEKLYGQRGDPSEMAELGIDLVGPKSDGGKAGGGPDLGKLGDLLGSVKQGEKPGAQPGAKPGAPNGATAAAKPGAKPAAKPGTTKPGTAKPGAQKGVPADPKAVAAAAAGKPLPGADIVSGKSKAALTQVWDRIKPYKVELSLVPVVFIAMVWVSKRRKRRQQAAFVPEYMAVLPDADTDAHVMKHRVHALSDEEFELVVAMIHQRQGYRVSMPAALGGGRTGNFKLSRKSERLVVKCVKQKTEERVQVEQVRELHEAMTDGSVTGGLFVASCGFTWDARHFAKTRKIRLINAKTLDAQLDEAQAGSKEDLLSITPWIQKFMAKAEMTTPHCPECEAEMDIMQAGEGGAWLCSQRPECSGRRMDRKHRKSARAARTLLAESAPEIIIVQKAAEKAADESATAAQEAQPAAKGAAEATQAKAASEKPEKDDSRDIKVDPFTCSANSIVPELQRVFLPGTIASKQKAGSGAGAEKGAAKDAPAPARPVAEERMTASQRPAFVPGLQAAEPPQSPDAARAEPPKNNWGLINTVAADFRRRGFRLEKDKPATPGAAPKPGGTSASTPPQPANPGGLRLEKKQAPPKPTSNAA